MTIQIRQLDTTEEPPYELLLLADPSKALVDEYIHKGVCFLANDEGQVVGEFVLLQISPITVEIMNVAVAEAYQGRGIGKMLIMRAIEEAKELGASVIEIGTGNSSSKQLQLYQKCGIPNHRC